MRTFSKHSTLFTLILLAAPATLHSQGFSSGSDESYGPLNVTANTTLDIPADGIFHCTTVTIASGTTVTFNRNARNTPIYILATGDVNIAGFIDVRGRPGTTTAGGVGGPGGYDGGAPESAGTPGGAGQGPGGGRPRPLGVDLGAEPNERAGPGAHQGFAALFYLSNLNRGQFYGSPLLLPLVGGSGGGGGNTGGGGGGGAILIASDTDILVQSSGWLYARGGNFTTSVDANPGSGGAIRLVAPKVHGNGRIYVQGGQRTNSDTGSYGRVRIDTLDRSGISFDLGLGSGGTPASIGSLMKVFPDPLPELHVIEAAGNVIDPALDPELITLPAGTDPNQTVKVRARNFGQVVPVTVALIPTNGDPVSYDLDIDNAAADPAEATVNVTFPVNSATTIQVWTRDP